MLSAELAAQRRGTCEMHGEEDVLRYELEDGRLVCAEAKRQFARSVSRWQPCDTPGHENAYAWRNPYTRRNEYLCGVCHAQSGDGVIQNKWAPRVSQPLGKRERLECYAKGVVGTRDCKGEVRWDSKSKVNLCNAHRGRTSAGDGYADRDWSGRA